MYLQFSGVLTGSLDSRSFWATISLSLASDSGVNCQWCLWLDTQ